MVGVKLVKMSTKGQLVVPEDVREGEGFEAGDMFVAVRVKDGVLFKRVIPNLKEKYEKLSKQISKQWKAAGVTEKTINEAVQWERRQSSR